VTDRSVAAVFSPSDSGRGTDPQDAGGVDAPARERRGDHLAAACRYPAPVLVLLEKEPPRALLVLTPEALGPVGLVARLAHRRAVTGWTLTRNGHHRFLLAIELSEALIPENYLLRT